MVQARLLEVETGCLNPQKKNSLIDGTYIHDDAFF